MLAEVKSDSMGDEMTNYQGKTWARYRKECKANNVEPVRADWLGITYTDEELDAQMVRSMQRRQPQRAFAATA